jgi:hypothetical protein
MINVSAISCIVPRISGREEEAAIAAVCSLQQVLRVWKFSSLAQTAWRAEGQHGGGRSRQSRGRRGGIIAKKVWKITRGEGFPPRSPREMSPRRVLAISPWPRNVIVRLHQSRRQRRCNRVCLRSIIACVIDVASIAQSSANNASPRILKDRTDRSAADAK